MTMTIMTLMITTTMTMTTKTTKSIKMSAQLTPHSLTDRSYIAVGLWVCISLEVQIMSAFLVLQLACHALVQAL
jgi:hypothetical protein